MWLIFGTEISHNLGAWAANFQISNASFTEVITERSICDQIWENVHSSHIQFLNFGDS